MIPCRWLVAVMGWTPAPEIEVIPLAQPDVVKVAETYDDAVLQANGQTYLTQKAALDAIDSANGVETETTSDALAHHTVRIGNLVARAMAQYNPVVAAAAARVEETLRSRGEVVMVAADEALRLLRPR